MHALLDTLASPFGAIVFAADENGALLRVQFAAGNYRESIETALTRAGFAIHHVEGASGRTEHIRREFAEYWAGTRRAFDMPLALHGTAWQLRVWDELRRIPFAETRTYAELAARLGNPRGARAVGAANGANRLPIVVPCHRLVGAHGELTGYDGGMRFKRALLDHEAAVAAASRPA